MSALTKDKLIFDPADLADSDNMGVYMRAGSDGDLISSTNVGGKEGMDVNLINTSIDVTATDLDIRDLDQAQDSVAIGDGTDIVAVSGSGELSVVDTNIALLTKAEDSAHVSGDSGIQALAVRADADGSLVGTDGDYAPLQVDAQGKLKVAATINANFEYAEDSAHTTGDSGAFILAVANHTQGALHSADGDYAALQVDAEGRLRVIADLDLVGDLVADGAADSEDPLKVGSHAYDQASPLAAVDAGDKANLASDLYRRVFINDAPAIAVATATVTVGATEVAVPATNLAGRTRMIIQNTSNNPVYVGATGLSTSDGIQIAKGATLTLEIGEAIDLFAIAGSAGNVIRVMELA